MRDFWACKYEIIGSSLVSGQWAEQIKTRRTRSVRWLTLLDFVQMLILENAWMQIVSMGMLAVHGSICILQVLIN